MSIVNRSWVTAGLLGMTAAGITAVPTLSCSKSPTTPGQLVMSVESDVALPTQIDTVRVEVLVDGSLQFGNDYSVGPDALLIPATLTILPGSDPSAPVTIRVIGVKAGVTRTLRETVTTIPSNRAASLRMPIQWLCVGSATTDATGNVVSTCGANETCAAGGCVPSQVDPGGLPSYDAGAVFGGASTPTGGTCFDTVACMSAGTVVQPDAQCTVIAPTGGLGINVALGVANDGICDPTGTTCYVPLDGDSPEGWTMSGDRLALPPAACARLSSGLVTGIVVSSACATKTEATPPCGPWSSVQASSAPASVEDAAVPVTVVGSVTVDGGAGTPCCPLLADGTRLYTCVCGSASTVDVVGIDPTGLGLASVATLFPTASRPYIAAALDGGTFFWTDRAVIDGGSQSLLMTTNLTGGQSTRLSTLDGDLFDQTTLLIDSSNVYALASQVQGAPSGVQLVEFDRTSGNPTSFPTGAGTAFLQMVQDSAAVYVIGDVDQGGDGGSLQRQSAIEKLAKAGGGKTVLSQAAVTTDNVGFGGYVGLALDGTTLYALSESSVSASGTLDVSVVSMPTTGGGASMTPIYAESLDPTRTTLRLLGATQGLVILARSESNGPDAGSSLQSSSVLAVSAAGGLPRIAADFLEDVPVGQLVTPTFDPAGVYWLNESGTVYRLAIAAAQ